MPFTNLDNRHFSAAEKTAINTAITSIETAVATKLTNLSGEERQKYGSINEQNKLIVNKVKDFRDNQPALSSPDIDWTEYANDFDSRAFLQNIIVRLQSMIDGLSNSKILHDFDNYQAALTDYDYTKYKSNTGATGYQTKLDELSQFFTGGSTAASKNKTTPDTPTNP
jgi:hypothetical protein